MQKSLAVANYFIDLATRSGSPPTHMKIQKLLFFAHGWHLALTDQPLLDEIIQAWKWGPVVPNVYQEFKTAGRSPITTKGTELVSTSQGLMWIAPEINDPTGYVPALLNKIWEVFGPYTGLQLSEMTHAQGTPWKTVVDACTSGLTLNCPISDDLIKSYFKGLSNARQ